MLLEPPVNVKYYDFIIQNNDDYLSVILLTALMKHYPEARILFCLYPVYTTLSVNPRERGIHTFFDYRLAFYVLKHLNLQLKDMNKAWTGLLQKHSNIEVTTAGIIDQPLKLHQSEQTSQYRFAYPFIPVKMQDKHKSRLSCNHPIAIKNPSFHQRSCLIKNQHIHYYKGLRKFIKSLFVPEAYSGFAARYIIHTGIDQARHLEVNGFIIGRRHLKDSDNLYEKRLYDISAAMMIKKLITNQNDYQAYRCDIDYEYYRGN